MLTVFAELKKAARIKYPTAGEEQLPAMALGHLKFMAANWGSLNHYLKGQISPAKLAAKDNLSQVIMALKPGTNGQKPTHHPSVLDNMTTEQLLNRKSIDQVVEDRIAQRKKEGEAALELIRNLKSA